MTTTTIPVVTARSQIVPVLTLIGLYVALGLWWFPPGVLTDRKQGLNALAVATIFPVIASVITHRLRTGLPYPAAWRETVTGGRLYTLVVYALGSQVFFAAFMAWKAYLPTWGHFWADPLLARADHALLLGRDAWTLIPAWAIPTLDLAYYLWLPVLVLMIGWRAFRGDHRFFLAGALCWILLGTGLALLFHSAGPIFYGDVTGEPRFAELHARLSPTPLHLHYQRMLLWEAYSVGQSSSISAFPSMHITMLALFILAVPTARTRWALGGFLVLTALATIALGWHYALDVPVAILGAYGCWRLAGWILRET